MNVIDPHVPAFMWRNELEPDPENSSPEKFCVWDLFALSASLRSLFDSRLRKAHNFSCQQQARGTRAELELGTWQTKTRLTKTQN